MNENREYRYIKYSGIYAMYCFFFFVPVLGLVIYPEAHNILLTYMDKPYTHGRNWNNVNIRPYVHQI